MKHITMTNSSSIHYGDGEPFKGVNMIEHFVWPSNQDRADDDELNRVCEYAEELERLLEDPNEIRLPSNVEQARAMAIAGINYLDLHAPDQLRQVRKQEWIYCSKETPKLGENQHMATCNVLTADGKVMAMEWTQNLYAATERGRAPRWEWHRRLSPWKVIAWQPLPEAP